MTPRFFGEMMGVLFRFCFGFRFCGSAGRTCATLTAACGSDSCSVALDDAKGLAMASPPWVIRVLTDCGARMRAPTAPARWSSQYRKKCR